MKKINLVFAIGNKYGLGHAKRIEKIVKFIDFNNYKIQLHALFDDKNTRTKINIENLKTHNYILKNLKKENFNEFFNCDILLFDCAINDFKKKLNLFLNNKNISTEKIIFFDGLGFTSFEKELNSKNLNKLILINPYRDKNSKNVLAGQEFLFLNNKKYSYKSSKYLSDFLITCGGSDPDKFTIKYISILEFFDQTYKINILIGKYFSKGLIKQILKQTNKSKHDYRLIYNETDIIGYLKKTKACLLSYGLTKYESVQYCKKIIMMYNSEENKMYNELFKKKFYSLNLPYYSASAQLSKKLSIFIKKTYKPNKIKILNINENKKLLSNILN